MDKIQIDSFLKGTERFWKDLEEHCVIDCCGLDSLNLTDERILQASGKVNEKLLIQKFNDLIEYLEASPNKYVQSREILISSKEKSIYLNLFEDLRAKILGIHSKRES